MQQTPESLIYKFFKCSVAFVVCTNSTSAQTFLDFSNNLTGWTVFGSSSSAEIKSTTYSTTLGGTPFSLTPPTGQNMVLLQPYGSINISNIDTNLGLTSGTMLAQVSTGSGPAGSQLTTTNYGGITRTLNFATGNYSFAWAYAAGDYLPFTDGVFFSLAGSGTSTATILARNGSASITPGSQGYPTGTAILQSYGFTAWSTYTFSIATAGDYTVGFGGFNALDTGLNPLLFIASTPGTFTGTPVATSGGSSPPALTNITSSNVLTDVLSTVNPVFEGGTLNLSNSNSSSQNFTITTNGTINISSGSATLSGNITNTSGQTGSLIKTGAGTLTLLGINLYTGGTTVSQGTLIGNTNSLQGNIVNNATVRFNQASNGSYSGAMTGTGRLVLTGSGKLTLGNSNTHSGGTEVQSGSNLEISSASALGSGTLSLIGTTTVSATLSTTETMTITNPISVAYDPTFNVASGTTTTISSVIADGSAPGDVVVTGGGTLKLTNVNTYSGLTTIDSGSTLALSGSGSIANSKPVTNNGTFDISSAAGNITIGGNYVQGSTGTLKMGFSPANNQELIIDGSASLSGSLNIVGTSGTYVPGRYRIISANSLAGTYSNFSSNISSLTRLDYSIAYDSLGAYLVFTPNLFDTQQSLINTASILQGTFSLQDALMNNGFANDCNVFDTKGICISTGGRRTNVQTQEVGLTSALLISSLRLDTNNSRVGVWFDQNLSVSSNNIQLSNRNPMIGLFAVWSERPDSIGSEVKLSAAYGKKDVGITRDIFGTSENGAGGSKLVSLGTELIGKHGFSVKNNVVVSPYAGIRYTQSRMDEYSESSSSSVTAPLSYSALNTNRSTIIAGAETTYRGINKTTLFTRLGLEKDIDSRTGYYTASGISGITPVNFNPNPSKTRPIVVIGGHYDISKNERFSFTGIYRQESFQSISSTSILGTYTIGM